MRSRCNLITIYACLCYTILWACYVHTRTNELVGLWYRYTRLFSQAMDLPLIIKKPHCFSHSLDVPGITDSLLSIKHTDFLSIHMWCNLPYSYNCMAE